ncbi:MAG: PorT family protein [Bacteroidales bacterium]|nr:PorT family protein [Bacteroidales bacterium]MDE6231315.1 PorT family protein [Muribaculaceae bacterium]
MKKIASLVLVAVALLSAFSANAGLRWGVKAGLNINKIDLSAGSSQGFGTFDGNNRCGWTAGLMGEYMIPMVGVGVDLSLMYTRMESNPGVEYSSDSERLPLGKNFLEIPLNLKYRLSIPAISRIFAPAIYTGPTLALCLDGDKNAFETKTCQWGWNLGLSFELIRHLQLSAGYTWGINNIAEKLDVNKLAGMPGMQVENLKAKNNYWTVTVGWLF